MTINKQFLLDSRPQGEASASNFKLVSVQLPALRPGQVLVRHHFLSLDPYMRGRMNDAKSYAQPQPLGQVMQGGTVGEVVSSENPRYAVGDKVLGFGGWQEYSVVDGDEKGSLRKVDQAQVPLSAYLGVLGMPGVTAWHGLVRICQPKAGQTVAVSAASGAVGGVVGQLAKRRGCRAVGIAGGAEKCAYVVKELGFDACVDYKAHPDASSLDQALAAVTPDGVDGYFENVGGSVMNAVFARMNAFGRVAVCGMIAGYDGAQVPLSDPSVILRSRLLVQGFIVSEQPDSRAPASAELAELVGSGQLKYRESIALGLEAAPQAFLGLLKGQNFGKQLVKLV
jgi:NADPH-dependent curcumin reductase CurA